MNRLAAVLLTMALAACAGPGGGTDASPSSAPAARADGDLLAFSASDLSGRDVTGESLRGDVLALWFWAPW